MIRKNVTLFFLFSCQLVFGSDQWRMPTAFEEYNPHESEKTVEKKKPIIHTPSLQHVLQYMNENYHGTNKAPAPPEPLIVNTPMRLQLSMEFSKLRESMVGVSYSPREHAAICERASSPLSASVDHDIDVIASTISAEWSQAEYHIKQAQLLLKNATISAEERHHYRLKSLILGLQILYRYRKYMPHIQQKQRKHHCKMLKLLFAARISFAISTPMEIPGQRWYVREEYRYKKVDDFDNIKKMYDKLNNKLTQATEFNPHGKIIFHINDTPETSQSILQLPTQPIAIPRS